jgi:hypothetical protein
VEPRCPQRLPVKRHANRVLGEDRLLAIVTLIEANAFPTFEIDGGNDLH